jgi:hypothetical protein
MLKKALAKAARAFLSIYTEGSFGNSYWLIVTRYDCLNLFEINGLWQN